MIWEFRFRDGVRGVVTKHVEADTLAEADATARAWVNQKPGTNYIPNSCEAWLVTLAAVEAVAEPAPETATGKPSQTEQKQRLVESAAAKRSGTGVGSAVKGEAERVGA